MVETWHLTYRYARLLNEIEPLVKDFDTSFLPVGSVTVRLCGHFLRKLRHMREKRKKDVLQRNVSSIEDDLL